MTDAKTQTIPTTSLDPDVAAGVAQFLSPVVVNLQALAVDGKQAHWHVRGANFIGVHEFLDTFVAHVQGWADLAAERIVALGLPVDARIQSVAEKTTTPALADGFQQADATVAAVIAQIDATLAVVRTAIEELDELDLPSQDVAIEIANGLDKDRWFLFSHVAS
ncbi:DNA starvation/stationary phase protection protein [Protaetiibacter sp. SSC-01]|uniref:Dps family protein n=1 Tax=Protaetiibacter sp. SSC-01 TaxID=2759943 RepID=UPI001656F255|nr:DNA starvation/stationary phase protection protein [Protaetiibacter sp. SSC-01]QNO38344.1 DNA starvation/stationary phase protection protein [Protaetiibacter sp. SSC-01]